MNYCGDCIWFENNWCTNCEHKMAPTFEACTEYEGWEDITEENEEDEM